MLYDFQFEGYRHFIIIIIIIIVIIIIIIAEIEMGRGPGGSKNGWVDVGRGSLGSWVTWIVGHMDRGSIFVTHFHLCWQP